MTPSLLVLGGSGFVGRAAVDEGLARGWEVATFNRGHRLAADPRVLTFCGERLQAGTLTPLGARTVFRTRASGADQRGALSACRH